MIEMGIVVALGLIVTFCKLGWRARIWMLSYPVAMDLMVFIALCTIHWGTFSGVMVATVGALFCSIFLSLGRKLFGYTERGKYYAGIYDVLDKLR